MNVQWQLHPHGNWCGDHEPLVYANGKYGYASQPSVNAESIYLNGKLIVIGMIATAVDGQLPALSEADRNSLIDAICASWVTKVNMSIGWDGVVSCNLMIPRNAGGLEIRQDGTIHYWTDDHVDTGDVKSILISQIKVIVGKVHTAVSAKGLTASRTIYVERMILKDVFDQFVLNVS